MIKAAAIGSAAHAGTAFQCAYSHAAKASTAQPAITLASQARTRPGVFLSLLAHNGPPACAFGIAVIIAFGLLTSFASPLEAKDPPPDLARRVSHRETETEAERSHYAYTQSVRLQELDRSGVQAGEYREVREVIFSPTGERTERFSGVPVSHLKNLVMTEEDFSDLREVQPLILTGKTVYSFTKRSTRARSRACRRKKTAATAGCFPFVPARFFPDSASLMAFCGFRKKTSP